ncbi:MAG: hypothetical protein COU07_00055 [Candidatus Harrisonbacteria bacterium CG10_big_fil_rev_8_21_14_0_10_40_38]|uniref:Uncharacterized protein n=1 Tax=Candidatus Harrisonbacteria bacterium CG10_big_fil_rev_8_21_14_0_10_40_38 TaxID=1974583 RepID=A0A2H0USC1_9BACT|nr:MAG: hypothetical protein COU07_00055 [Candidatus Harrisonbacteria bacterium CG10_big_fil_rev_8_21_14_0_10_40_38]
MAESTKPHPDKIIVREGRVVYLEEWTLWNGSEEMTPQAEMKNKDDFSVFSYDPEHGGSLPVHRKTMLEAASEVFHGNIAKKIADLFDLENPTEDEIRDIHYRKGDGLKVEFQ